MLRAEFQRTKQLPRAVNNLRTTFDCKSVTNTRKAFLAMDEVEANLELLRQSIEHAKWLKQQLQEQIAAAMKRNASKIRSDNRVRFLSHEMNS